MIYQPRANMTGRRVGGSWREEVVKTVDLPTEALILLQTCALAKRCKGLLSLNALGTGCTKWCPSSQSYVWL